MCAHCSRFGSILRIPSRLYATWDNLVPNEQTYFGGSWKPSLSGKTFPVHNPATGQLLRQVPTCSTSEAELAIQTSIQSQKEWASKPVGERASIVRKWAESIKQHAESLSELITAENGKSLSDARAEVLAGVSALEWYAEEAKHSLGHLVPSHRASNRRQMIMHQPVGTVAVITPWNFPLSMITRKVGAAISAGCAVIVKPAEDTPLSALALNYLGVEKAGLPAGLLSTLTTTRDPNGAQKIGELFCEHPFVRLIGFTGSTAVGKMLYKNAATFGKRILLEMGGNAPFIVFDSANLDNAVAGTMACKFRCSGQTCISANRIFVQEKIYDQFVTKLSDAIASLVIGDGCLPGTNLGPLINAKALEKVENLVSSARKDGARVVIGGNGRLTTINPSTKQDYALGYFYPATLLADCLPSMDCMKEEIFGPVAAVCKFRNEDEVIRLANGTNHGLAGYFYTQNINQAWRVAESLQFGMVGINTGLVSTVELPFGGVKDSGIGREGGPDALLEFMDVKTISWQLDN